MSIPPYALKVPEKYMNIEMMLATVEPGEADSKNTFAVWRHFFRFLTWYWWGLQAANPLGMISDEELAGGPRIFAGAVFSKFRGNETSGQFSEKWITDDLNGVSEWYILVVELCGPYKACVDVMVLGTVTVAEFMLFLIEKLAFDKTSTKLNIWGMDNKGHANAENPDAVLTLTLAHTSPVMQMTCEQLFARMDEIAMKLANIETTGESDSDGDDEPFHNESELVRKKVLSLEAGK